MRRWALAPSANAQELASLAPIQVLSDHHPTSLNADDQERVNFIPTRKVRD